MLISYSEFYSLKWIRFEFNENRVLSASTIEGLKIFGSWNMMLIENEYDLIPVIFWTLK